VQLSIGKKWQCSGRQSSFAEATEDEKSREQELVGDLIVSGWFMPERLF